MSVTYLKKDVFKATEGFKDVFFCTLFRVLLNLCKKIIINIKKTCVIICITKKRCTFIPQAKVKKDFITILKTSYNGYSLRHRTCVCSKRIS
jgi:hypothetical protein